MKYAKISQDTGTVFFITDDGYLISNGHVIKGAAKVRLRNCGVVFFQAHIHPAPD